jgi:hypothetical protein
MWLYVSKTEGSRNNMEKKNRWCMNVWNYTKEKIVVLHLWLCMYISKIERGVTTREQHDCMYISKINDMVNNQLRILVCQLTHQTNTKHIASFFYFKKLHFYLLYYAYIHKWCSTMSCQKHKVRWTNKYCYQRKLKYLSGTWRILMSSWGGWIDN